MKDWNEILKLERMTATPGDPFGWGQKYNLGIYYQGKYYAEHTSDDPECIQRANALSFMLENLPLTFFPQQEFFGGAETFRCNVLPGDITQLQYDAACEAFRKHGGRRDFTTGSSHTAPDYETLMKEGLGGFILRAETKNSRFHTVVSSAMLLTLRAISKFFERAADSCAAMHPDAAKRLKKLAHDRPESFEEALQMMWLIFVILEADTRGHNALARVDQYLYPAYQKSAPAHDYALNLLCHIWAKIEGFHEVTNICIGGVKPDGSDASNELSYLILEATDAVHSASTNLSARFHANSSDHFILACVNLIRTGIGFPAVFNDEVNIPMLCNLGIPVEAARDYALFGCVEPLIPGRQVAWSDGRFNMPECFIRVIECLSEFKSYEELWSAFKTEMRLGMKLYSANYNNRLLSQPSESHPDPMLSALTRDCIGRGKDINDGGAEFPRMHGVGMMGLGTLADSLAAIKKLVYEERRIAPERLMNALKNDFDDEEELRLTLLNCAPKYGNDNKYCDAIAQEIVKFCGELAFEFRAIDGGFILSAMASNVQNIPAGAAIGATPDGRHAGEPLSDAASPNGGRDRNGPTAFVNSIISPDYSKQSCTVVNMRFLPEMFEHESGQKNMLALLKRFIKGGGQEMQFNVTNNRILEDAVREPEKYADLIVRVSGFSAFFTKLAPEVQKDIMRRNAHGS